MDFDHLSKAAYRLKHSSWCTIWTHQQISLGDIFHAFERPVEHQNELPLPVAADRPVQKHVLAEALGALRHALEVGLELPHLDPPVRGRRGEVLGDEHALVLEERVME